MLGSKTKALIRFGLMAIAVLAFCVLASNSALAQCVMCKASLTGNSAFAKNLNIGVLVLLVPPVSIFCTIFILAIRHRKSG
jgi:hypothetical protein